MRIRFMECVSGFDQRLRESARCTDGECSCFDRDDDSRHVSRIGSLPGR
jgi:hypothetical protein